MSLTLRQCVKKNIRAYRLKADLSQEKLAKKAKMTLRYVSYLENNEANLTLDVLDRIAKGVGVPAAKLLEGDNALDAEDHPKKLVLGLKYAIKVLQATLSKFD